MLIGNFGGHTVGRTIDDVVADARAAEQDGFTTYALSQTFGYDTMGVLAVVGREVPRIDLATGVSGAGRSPKEGTLHAEVSEGYHAYNVAQHRHLAEFDQEFSKAAGQRVEVTFVPHLLPQNRGILATIYVRGTAEMVHAALASAYADEPFVTVLPLGDEKPSAAHRSRLALAEAAGTVLAGGLSALGISAPDRI